MEREPALDVFFPIIYDSFLVGSTPQLYNRLNCLPMNEEQICERVSIQPDEQTVCSKARFQSRLGQSGSSEIGVMAIGKSANRIGRFEQTLSVKCNSIP